MVHINFITCSNSPYYPNWDKIRYPEDQYDIQFNSSADIIWDCVVIGQNVPNTRTFKCRCGNVIYVCGEPPLMFPLPHVFTEQFDCIVCPHKHVRHRNKILSHGFLSWTLGRSFSTGAQKYTYHDLANLEPSKTKLISVVSSNQKMMPGHNKRVAIINQLMKDYPDQIQFFGKGYNFIDIKGDALIPYMFHICMENSSIPYYWTEKISDPILAQSVPIYAGCKNISDYFGNEGYYHFDIDDYLSLKAIIEAILANPEKKYLQNKPGLERMRKVLMEEENIVPFAIEFCEQSHSDSFKEYTIKSITNNKAYNFELAVIRVRRLVFRIFYKLFQR